MKAGSTPATALELRAPRPLASVPTALEHPVDLYLESLAPGSRPTQTGALRHVARFYGSTPAAMDWARLRRPDLVALRSWLASTFAPSTANRILVAVRGVLRAAVELGQVERADVERALELPPVAGARVSPGRSLEGWEIGLLFEACHARGSAVDARNAALVALLYGCGMRRAEACGLELVDVQGDAVKVLGKGNKERAIPMPLGTRAALVAWLHVRGYEPGRLLLRFNARGQILPGSSLASSSVAALLRALATVAGVAPFSAHDLRRTYIGDLLDRGADLATVQALAGHASPTVTSSYDRRGLRARVDAVAALEVPF